MTTSLCFDFLRHADWVWERILVAHKNGFPFGEETITETILLDLKANHPDKLFIQPFSKRRERWNGADWEWWIGKDGNWIGMRVKAKRVALPDEEFHELFYKSKSGPKRQIEYLIDAARADGLAPIYALYVHSFYEARLASQVRHCDPNWHEPFHQYGCLVAHAQDVKRRASLKLSEIADFSFPWHLLVCHCLPSVRGPSGPADFAEELLRQSGEEEALGPDERSERYVPEPRPELPEHAQFLRFKESGEFRDEIIDRHLKKWNLGGLAVFDLGGKE